MNWMTSVTGGIHDSAHFQFVNFCFISKLILYVSDLAVKIGSENSI